MLNPDAHIHSNKCNHEKFKDKKMGSVEKSNQENNSDNLSSHIADKDKLTRNDDDMFGNDKRLTPNVEKSKRTKTDNLVPVVKQPSAGPPSTLLNGGDKNGHPESIASFD